MKIRIIDAALLIAAIAGGVMAVSSARQLQQVHAEHARLSHTTGNLAVTDPEQMHILRIATGEPLHFAWRVYAPAGRTLVSHSGASGGGSSSSTHSNSREFIGRIRFTQHRSGQILAYSTFGGGASSMSFGSAEAYQFLLDNFDQLDIEQVGLGETARVKPGQAVTLLQISLPESLARKAREQFTDANSLRVIPDVYQFTVKIQP